MTSAEKKLKAAFRKVDKLRRELRAASEDYLRLVKPTSEEMNDVSDELWSNVSSDIGKYDLPQWEAVLADEILDRRK